jgi:uncharacterized protein DUF2817
MPRKVFANNYFEARAKFLAAADGLGLDFETKTNPYTKGPGGEDLHSDLVTLGSPDAKRRLLLISATHGVEGFCGSGCQVAFLKSDLAKELPDDISITILHALNPHGFAWLRRVNENNIDLNRNFVDFAEPLPTNEHYEALRSVMILPDLEEQTLKQANRDMVKFGKKFGFEILQEGLTKGQYTDAEGLYFGGAEPSWSNRILREVLSGRIAGADQAVQIDFHTGLGPSGYGELITEYASDDPAYLRTKEWLGSDATSTLDGSSSSAALTGTTDHAFHQELSNVEGVSVALEFGTMPSDAVFNATRADNWLHLNDNPASDLGRSIKADIRNAFYPEDEEWMAKILDRSQGIITKAVLALNKT